MRALFLLFTFVVISVLPCHPQSNGFYKDVFIDAGAGLGPKKTIEAVDSLGLSSEYVVTNDSQVQNRIMVANDNDVNGALLYPDGQPRFRLMFVNGGLPAVHGYSLGADGRDRIRMFYNQGGCYVGVCAGAFLASLASKEEVINDAYYHIWPGRVTMVAISVPYTGHFFEPGSPLLAFGSFDAYIDSVFYHKGCYTEELTDCPDESEILLRYDCPSERLHQKPSCWAYKKDKQSGRLVVIGAHPEKATRGETLHLLRAMVQYALAGQGAPLIKAELLNGQTRRMDKATGDSMPEFTRIGDKQYHHFTMHIPQGIKNFKISLQGKSPFDMHLYLKKGAFAFAETADLQAIGAGANKEIRSQTLAAGVWYVGVECASTVESVVADWGYDYVGNIDLLSGAAYSITAQWETATSVAQRKNNVQEFLLRQNYPNPFNNHTALVYDMPEAAFVSLKIYSIDGTQVADLVSGFQSQGCHRCVWDAGEQAAGVYLVRLTAGGYSKTKKIILEK